MAIPYSVVAGDYLILIAKKFGIPDWRTIYYDPSNAAFRAKRPNPNLIFVGDVVMIPVASPSSSPTASLPPPGKIITLPPPPLALVRSGTVSGTPIATSGAILLTVGNHLEVRLTNKLPLDTDVEVSTLAHGALFPRLRTAKLVSLTSFGAGTAAFVTPDAPPVGWEVTVKIISTPRTSIATFPGLPSITIAAPGMVGWEIWSSF